MKKNVETIERTIKEEKVTYIACDGTVFTNEEDCKKWENSYKCTLQKTFNAMPKYQCPCNEFGIGWDSEDQHNYIVIPKTETDVTTLNSICEIVNGCGSDLNMNMINQKLVVSFWWCCKDRICWAEGCSMYLYEEFKRNIMNEWEKAEKSFETEN